MRLLTKTQTFNNTADNPPKEEHSRGTLHACFQSDTTCAHGWRDRERKEVISPRLPRGLAETNHVALLETPYRTRTVQGAQTMITVSPGLTLSVRNKMTSLCLFCLRALRQNLQFFKLIILVMDDSVKPGETAMMVLITQTGIFL